MVRRSILDMVVLSLLQRCPDPAPDSNRQGMACEDPAAMRPYLALAALLLCAPLAAAAASPPRARPDAAAMEAARRFLCPHGGMPVRRQGGRCRPGTGETSVRGWELGLPPAAHRQAPCPDGTHPTAALARPDSVRCVPD
jgi:hypothetical protein